MRILISACLLGVACRYDGGQKACPAALKLGEKHQLTPVCPEQLGGLPTPRTPCERQGEKVVSAGGEDRTAAYLRGAKEAEGLLDILRCDCAVLKARSPMCGKDCIYDGSFSGCLTAGDGVLAERLKARGIPVYTEEEIEKID